MLILAGCATEDQRLSPVVETIPITTAVPTTAVRATTPATTEAAVTTTVASVPATFIPGIDGPEPEGLPPFLVAVREDHAVIEINTISGRTTRVLVPPPEPDPPNAEIEGNTIGSVWWHRDTGRMVIEEGPEPAAGNIWHQPIGADFVDARDGLSNNAPGFRSGAGWQAELSPNGDYTLHTGYAAFILRTGEPDDAGIDVSPPIDDGGFSFTPAWLRDRIGVAYTFGRWEDDGETYELHIVELDERAVVVERRMFELRRRVTGLAVRADGALVVLFDEIEQQRDRDGGSSAGVLDPDTGETIAEFTLEPGSHSMGYDQTGTYLLYVDGEGRARWRGRGQSGIIAENLLHADW